MKFKRRRTIAGNSLVYKCKYILYHYAPYIVCMTFIRLLICITPNRSLDRQNVFLIDCIPLHPSSALLPSSCLPIFLDVARYIFDKAGYNLADSSTKQECKSNDRFGFKCCRSRQMERRNFTTASRSALLRL